MKSARMVWGLVVLATLATCAMAADAPDDETGWVSLFDGKTFDGWKVGKNADSFKIQDGMIVVNGHVAHLFYDGDVNHHDFKNFALKAEVMTFPHANSGIYFHTKFQEEGFPKFGIESQVNNSHGDPIRTGSLWGIKNVYKVPVKDEVWFTQEIIVRGAHVVVKLDGKTVVDYMLPKGSDSEYDLPTKNTYLPHGTFALQGHDPGSKVYFKNIRVKVLPD
jgi:hypothetical protein